MAVPSIATAVAIFTGSVWMIGRIVDRANQRELTGHFAALNAGISEEAHLVISNVSCTTNCLDHPRRNANGKQEPGETS